MKTVDSIPTSKIQRASKIVKTGMKVGVNYLKYYGNKVVSSEEEAREKLDQDNAEDIYDGLKELKGSALKMAQMLSMDKSVLPQAYVEKFSLSQFSVPPLSFPLVVKTFRKYFGQHPNELFDSFEQEAFSGASIGQVHRATKDGRELAVKVQYPGVAESISSDLALVKPFALRMFNIKAKDSDKYFQEVEQKLLEETDYRLELKQSRDMAEACAFVPGLAFPTFYEDLSSERVLTMDWMKGEHLSEYVKHKAGTEEASQIGQILWDFYMVQLHRIKKVHADPHPGNFLVSPTNELVALDFGCVKTIPDDFYEPFFKLLEIDPKKDEDIMVEHLEELQVLLKDDKPEERALLKQLFGQVIDMFAQPFRQETFDFSDPAFFDDLVEFGKESSTNPALRKMDGSRGVEHFIYVNRTLFGLFSLMYDLKATNVEINRYKSL